MHIVFAASECVPFAKTGGLADVVGALPKALVLLGHRVTVYLPLYKSARALLPQELNFAIRSLTIPFPQYSRFAGIVDGGVRDGVQYYFVDCPELYDRDGLYGPKTSASDYADNAERFGLYCRAVIEASKQLGVPDIFHVHDWQAALLPILLRTTYEYDPLLLSAGTVLTIHNVGYQGWFPPAVVSQLLLPWSIFTPEKAQEQGIFNWLKGGLYFANYMTTVSPTYAEEIQTPEFGYGLDPVLRRRHWDLRGILNGVDYTEWNPANDRNLAAHFSPEKLQGKAECRRDLLHAFGLDGVPDTTPVLAVVSRFATQKGLDLIEQTAERLLERDVVLLALGSGESIYENFFRSLAARYPGRVAAHIQFDDALAHKVEAGADLHLIPSRYEPGGLSAMYALKYGDVPVVRATGGLKDTVNEWDAGTRTGTGFLFEGFGAQDLLAAIDRALAVFQEPESWKQLLENGMAQDFGWEKPAKEYVEVYEEVLRRRG